VSLSVRAYVAQVDRILAAAENLFGREDLGPGPVTAAAATGIPPAPAGTSALAGGASTTARSYHAASQRVNALDEQVTTSITQARTATAEGRIAASQVRQRAQATAAALTPATSNPAGVTRLVSTMNARLTDMQHHIGTTATNNAALAARFGQLADGYNAVATAYVPPKPPPSTPDGPQCWIGTKNGDIQKLCPSDTSVVTYVDDDGNYVAKDLHSGDITIMHRPGPLDGYPSACWLPTAGADRSICGPGTTEWMYPRDGSLITERIGPDGKAHIVYQTPLGPLVP